MFKIEKNIPVTHIKAVRYGVVRKYPLNDLQPGDSFFVPLNGTCFDSLTKLQTSISNCIYRFKKNHRKDSWVFTTSQIKGKNGVRAWRIA